MVPSTTTNWSSSPGAGAIEFSLADLDTYRKRLFANFALTVLFNAYGLYMILKHSPREMSTYRWYLLNILFWSFALDACFSLLFQPYPLLPIFGYCSMGIIAQFSDNVLISGYGILILTSEIALSCCGSILLALFYRMTALCSFDSFLVRAYHSWWGIALMIADGVVVYTYTAYFYIQIFAAIHPKLPEVREKYYAEYPGLRAILESDTLCILSTMDVPNMELGLLYDSLWLLFGLCYFAGTIFLALFTLWQRRNMLSPSTYRLHKQFIVALILQLIVPLGTMLFPVTGIVIYIYLGLPYPKAFDDLLLLVCSSHSTLNVLVMVACTRPYRDAAKAQMFRPIQLIFPRLFPQKLPPIQPRLTTVEDEHHEQQDEVRPIREGEIQRRFS